MKDTIEAQDGYKVRHGKKDKNNIWVFDGIRLLFRGRLRTRDDFNDECQNGNNEMAVEMEVFTTVKGNQFIYWADLETGENFITKVPVTK